MSKTVVQKFHALPAAFTLAIASLMSSVNSVAAQQSIPNCQPPSAGEYLLLVMSPSRDNQNQLRKVLPPDLDTSVCRYINDTVTRIGGFDKIDDANRWARYISNVAGLSAIITTRPADAAPQNARGATYNPQPLGNGFAVLVEFFNRPELANQVREAVEGDVGLVAYGPRHYLLAVYTTNQREAYTTLQNLSDKGFTAMLVDSRKVMMLRSAVKL